MNECVFSQYGKKVDSQVQVHMNIIVEEINRELKDVISVLVIGGLGRGEGSFILESGKAKPLNDYDIYLITKKKINFSQIKKISDKASKRIVAESKFSFSKGSSLMEFYVDIRNMTISELRKVEPMIKYYEIRESAKVIYGKDVLKQIPNFKLKDIPLEDGFRFLMNRMSLLVESFDVKNLKSSHVRKTILYYIGKNYLSFTEALLLLSGKFVPSYKKRMEILEKTYKQDFPELYKKIPNLPKKVRLFTQHKLKPNNKFLNSNPTKYWLEARRDSIEVVRYFMKRAFNLNSNSIISFANAISRMNNSFIKNYLRIFMRSKFRTNPSNKLLRILSPLARFYFNWLYYKQNLELTKKKNLKILFSKKDININLYSICPLVLFSLDDKFELNKDNFKIARAKLKAFFSSELIQDENSLREKYIDAFRIYQFLKA